MNRTKYYKISYTLQVIAIGIAGAALITLYLGFYVIALFIITVIALDLYRRDIYRNLMRGAKLVRKHQYTQAILEFENFLEQATVKPWFQKIYVLSWSHYTVNSKALTWNNIGACHYDLRQLTESRDAFNTALSLDPHFPIPYFNIARIDRLENNEVQAEMNFKRSAELGLTDGLANILVERSYGVSLPVNRATVFAEKLQDKAKQLQIRAEQMQHKAEQVDLTPYIETIEKLPPELERNLSNTSETLAFYRLV